MTPLIAKEIERHEWAMTSSAFKAVLAIADSDLDSSQYEYFHALSQETKLALATTFGKRQEGSYYSSVKGNVGFLMVDGPIMPRATWLTRASGLVSLDVLGNEFKALESNPNVDTIALLLDTPGGAVTGVSDFAALVKASEKKTLAYAWMAASAGYWIASAADEIILSATGSVGSIGVVQSILDTSEMDKKRGLREIEIVSSQSPNKRVDAKTAEGRSVIQRVVDDIADVFVATVAANRDTTVDHVLSDFGAGSMVVGERAVSAGMADKIQDAEDFVMSAVTDNKYHLTSVRADTTTEDQDMGNENHKPLTADQLTQMYPSAVGEIEEKAAATERQRIKGLEAIAGKFEKATPQVRDAAKKAVDGNKFDAALDDAAVMALVVDAVAKAQTEALDAAATPRQEAAKLAAHPAKAKPAGTDEAEKTKEAAREKALCAAMQGGN